MAPISFLTDFEVKTFPFLNQPAHVVQQTEVPTKAFLFDKQISTSYWGMLSDLLAILLVNTSIACIIPLS